MRTTIYYFTGTGNCLMVSRDIASKMKDAAIVSIAKAVKEEDYQVNSECIGFVLPVYYWGIPLIAAKFIEKLDLTNVRYIFAVATFGGSAGDALGQVSRLLKKKGASLASGFKILLPENYIPVYNPTEPKEQERQFKEEKRKIDKIVRIVNEQKDTGIEKGPKEYLKFLSPVVYKRSNKFYKDGKKFWTKDNCNSCGSCELVCPVDNIEMQHGRPKWKDSCEQCLACIQWCPKQAIEFGRSTSKRKRYRNPEVTIKDIIDSSKTSGTQK
ncbi:MAG: EFR1 family ferrodoxin [Clostridia bacterium]|nr:EFR1 family ferrodoxin [Clostridia bacterium]